MDSDLSLKILEFYVEIDKLHDLVNNKIFSFITKANELVQLSEDEYQIEKTLKLNMISLKGYVLDSDCVKKLKEKDVNDYSLQELKEYFMQYDKSYNEDSSKYYLAISLYELVKEIEYTIDKKVDLEIEKLKIVLPDIVQIKSAKNLDYEKLYFSLKNQLSDDFKDKVINEKAYNVCFQILNDVFNFYIGGYPDIPDEYLYKF